MAKGQQGSHCYESRVLHREEQRKMKLRKGKQVHGLPANVLASLKMTKSTIRGGVSQ